MKPVYRKYFTTIALVWASCLVLFIFIYMLALVPQKKSKKQIEKQLAEKKRMYDSAVQMAQEETKLRLNEQIEDLRNRLKVFAIDFEDLADLTFDIRQVANESNLASFSIKGQETRGGSAMLDGKYICENQINVDFTAGFNQFATFLNALERHCPLVFVDKFKITRSDRHSSGHRVNMGLAVFVRKGQDS